MKKMTESEWAVMEVLWTADMLALGEVVTALQVSMQWSRNTVFTYLTRMEKKGFVRINREQEKPYSAAVKREECAQSERNELLSRVYKGATCDLVAAFLKETKISKEEREQLKKMLDDMEV